MSASEVQLAKIRREILWGGGVWLLSGAVIGLGGKLGFYQPTAADGYVWLVFGFFMIAAQFLADCTEVVLQGIREATNRAK